MFYYRIRNWSRHYENNRTRELKEMKWVPVPNGHDGDGYTELVDHPNGAAHLGCWLAILQVASKCDPRGSLLRDGAVPHTVESMSRITRLPSKILGEAINRLVAIKWIEVQPSSPNEVTTIPQEGAEKPQADAPIPQEGDYGKEGNGSERKGREKHFPPLAKSLPKYSRDQVIGIYAAYPKKVGRGAAITAIERALVRIGHRDGVKDAVAWLLEKVVEFAESPKGNAGKFTPHAATWFNQERYDDDPMEWEKGGQEKHDDPEPEFRGLPPLTQAQMEAVLATMPPDEPQQSWKPSDMRK